jgi:hypothetical protein
MTMPGFLHLPGTKVAFRDVESERRFVFGSTSQVDELFGMPPYLYSWQQHGHASTVATATTVATSTPIQQQGISPRSRFGEKEEKERKKERRRFL